MSSRFKTVVTLALVCAALLSAPAEAARRLGGGRSFGQQSSNVTQRYATPAPAPTPGAQPGLANRPAAAPGAATPNPAAAASPARKPWGAMLGGLAAGLGLAWLAHSLGLGEAMGSMLTVLLLGLLAVMVVGWVLRSRQRPAGLQPAYAGGAGASDPQPATPHAYKPENVGNDASARPWESAPAVFTAQPPASPTAAASGGSMIGAALRGSQTWGIPEGFDSEGFLKAAKANFVSLQAAWDRGDIGALRVMMTDAMLTEIRAQLAERETHAASPNRTEVEMLEAHLLGIEDLGDEYLASVEFSGLIREDAAGPSPFREVWNMSKPKSGASGWLVSGLQALQ